MLLKFIERDTAMKIQVIVNGENVGEAYTASFYDLDTDTLFFVRCHELYDRFPDLPPGAHLKVTFWLRENMYMFEGRPIELAPHMGSNSVLIKQTTDIDVSSLRRDARNEMSVLVRLYTFFPYGTASVADGELIFTAETFDISAGGFCLVSNEPFEAKELLFTAEFNLSGRSDFLLPAKLVRRGDSPQTVLYHFDYGFVFLFDDCPNEKSRLSAAITDALFRSRLARVKR
jgi:hypothetical protein